MTGTVAYLLLRGDLLPLHADPDSTAIAALQARFYVIAAVRGGVPVPAAPPGVWAAAFPTLPEAISVAIAVGRLAAAPAAPYPLRTALFMAPGGGCEAVAAALRRGSDLLAAAHPGETVVAVDWQQNPLPPARQMVWRAASTPAPSGQPAWENRPGGLTPREREIARLLATGATDQRVAEQLHLSRRTVEKYEEHMRSKLGVPNRAGIAAWAAMHLGDAARQSDQVLT